MYKDRLIFNGYQQLSKLPYAFNFFTNGNLINKIDRRLFRTYSEENIITENPFDSNSKFYSFLLKNHLIGTIKEKTQKQQPPEIKASNSEKFKNSHFSWIFRIFIKCVGIKRFTWLTGMAQKLSRIENYYYILKK
jgi:hypothetical protein